MELVLFLSGQIHDIYALSWDRGDTRQCPGLEFFDEMADQSRKSMLKVLSRHAEHGPILNTQKSRLLKDGIFEFKSRQGDRFLFFYPEGQRGVTVITHGFRKGSPLRTQIQRAAGLRAEYYRLL